VHILHVWRNLKHLVKPVQHFFTLVSFCTLEDLVFVEEEIPLWIVAWWNSKRRICFFGLMVYR
jgi:hypothetical protein